MASGVMVQARMLGITLGIKATAHEGSWLVSGGRAQWKRPFGYWNRIVFRPDDSSVTDVARSFALTAGNVPEKLISVVKSSWISMQPCSIRSFFICS